MVFPRCGLLTRSVRSSSAVTAAVSTFVVALLLAGCGSVPAAHVGVRSVGSPGRYVALGDSYTAAPGVPVQTGPRACFRSDHDYPSLVAKTLHAGVFVDRSCSGADTTHMTQPQGPGIRPQFDALTATTDLVTVGIGGNDLSLFGALLGYCVQLAASDPQGSPCSHAVHKRPGAVHAALATIRRDVTKAFRGIRSRSPRATVVAVGYPQIVPAHGTCAALPLARGDYRLGRNVNRRLGEAVRAAARAAGVHFVDVWTPSAGHDVCGKEPWINGVHDAPGRAIPFHPFEVEQQAVARLVVRAVRRAASDSPSGAAS